MTVSARGASNDGLDEAVARRLRLGNSGGERGSTGGFGRIGRTVGKGSTSGEWVGLEPVAARKGNGGHRGQQQSVPCAIATECSSERHHERVGRCAASGVWQWEAAHAVLVAAGTCGWVDADQALDLGLA